MPIYYFHPAWGWRGSLPPVSVICSASPPPPCAPAPSGAVALEPPPVWIICIDPSPWSLIFHIKDYHQLEPSFNQGGFFVVNCLCLHFHFATNSTFLVLRHFSDTKRIIRCFPSMFRARRHLIEWSAIPFSSTCFCVCVLLAARQKDPDFPLQSSRWFPTDCSGSRQIKELWKICRRCNPLILIPHNGLQRIMAPPHDTDINTKSGNTPRYKSKEIIVTLICQKTF